MFTLRQIIIYLIHYQQFTIHFTSHKSIIRPIDLNQSKIIHSQMPISKKIKNKKTLTFWIYNVLCG